jgi:hypothetical protein
MQMLGCELVFVFSHRAVVHFWNICFPARGPHQPATQQWIFRVAPAREKCRGDLYLRVQGKHIYKERIQVEAAAAAAAANK